MLNKDSKTTNRHREAKLKDERHKEQSRDYGNRRRNAKNSKTEVGDTVLVKQPKANKLTPKFIVNPYIVKAKKGATITAENKSHTIFRNASFFKKIPKEIRIADDDELE